MTLTSTGTDLTVGVDSEIGALCQVIVHRPGLELDRLSPANIAELLFDDVLWAARARVEHDAFVEALRENDVTVHLFGDLLAGALATADGRAFALDRTLTAERLGAGLAREVRALFDDADPAALAEYLIGGVTKAELSPLKGPSLTWQALDIDDFVLTLLPNTLFQRDNAGRPCTSTSGPSPETCPRPACDTMPKTSSKRQRPKRGVQHLVPQSVGREPTLASTNR